MTTRRPYRPPSRSASSPLCPSPNRRAFQREHPACRGRGDTPVLNPDTWEVDVTYSVLVYPNITSPHNKLEADSYVIAVGQLVRALNRVRDDLEFTFLTPTIIESWCDIPNVTQLVWHLPTGNNAMRTYFDPDEFRRVIDWKNRSYDIVWCHLPEVAIDIKNTLWNGTNERPPIIGYCHWFEVPELVSFATTTLSKNLEGIVSMLECGVNSAWLVDVVMRHAESKYGDGPFTHALERRMRPMHLGIDGSDIKVALAEPGLLVWNHRTTTYTGWPETIAMLDRLWARRQDFRVMVTMGAGGLDKPWLVDAGITAPRDSAAYRTEYLTALSRAWYGLPRVNCQWALSVTDGMAVGVPYILPRDFCYPEMYGHTAGAYWYNTANELEATLERALDAGGLARMGASIDAHEAATRLLWANRVGAWSEQFDRAIWSLPVMGDRSKRYDDLLRYVQLDDVPTTKAELMKYMKWGVGIPWLPYRNRLRADGIRVTADDYTMEGS